MIHKPGPSGAHADTMAVDCEPGDAFWVGVKGYVPAGAVAPKAAPKPPAPKAKEVEPPKADPDAPKARS